MADQNNGAVVLAQQVLKQIKRFNIKVIGRLIEHQKVAAAGHQFGKQQACFFTTGQRAYRRARLPLVE